MLALTFAACGGGGSGGGYGAAPAYSSASPSPAAAASTAPAPTPTPTPQPSASPAAQPAGATGALQIAASAKLGKVLAAGNGMTLYIWDRDAPDKSNCSGGCASTWPPFTVSGEPVAPAGLRGKLALIARADGKMQVTYNGSPLYFYVGDSKPGDTTGDGVGGTWHAVTDP